MSKHSRLVYEFGPYRLDPLECRLLRSGKVISLRPKLLDLLAILVQHAGHMLTKDELMAAVWPNAVVEESNLAVSVTELRKILGDENYIETVARRGYRFAASVQQVVLNEEHCAPHGAASTDSSPEWTPPGGALLPDSPVYITRKTDSEFHRAITRHDSFVLIKGPRQVGKTSLLARGLRHAREAGAKVVLTDLQHLTTSAFSSVEKLLMTIGELMADDLQLDNHPHQMWNNYISPSSNFERYLRRFVLTAIRAPLVWALDETDRLFSCPFANDIFGMFRSWHNLRALEPEGPWTRLTIALAYATEAYLFINDLNQSPFNIGMRLTLDDFTLEQVSDLNHRYGDPLDTGEVKQYFNLLAGHPYLVHTGLYQIASHQTGLAAIAEQA
ncbi:MAG TPA: AAA-like domain-containing protein, partial [Candidatus Angelobacter sp.]|nr:AAA-like domain-containing protein [Candidatus Angelobacter sp.]